MFPLSRILDRAAALYGEAPAVADGAVRLSYTGLAKRVAALAGGLRARSIGPGDRVAILARNSFRYLEVNLACARAGIILVPLNIRLAPAEIERILALTEAKLLLRSLSHDTAVPSIAWGDEDGPGAGNSYEYLLYSGASLAQPVPVGSDAVAQIFFTSGTTGEPKGVCLTEGNLLTSALDSIIALALDSEDVWLHAPPMFHLVDAFAIWAITLVGGRHVITHFDPINFGPLVEGERITKTSLPPTLLDMIVRDSPIARFDLRSLGRISYGGAPMPDAVYARCVAALGCDLLQAYGITETGGLVCQQVPADLRGQEGARYNSVGRPSVHADVDLVDDGGRRLPPGVIGEFVVRGARVMSGYWRNPEATASVLHDGWYHTGDLGLRDADSRYTIVGRKKDMIISGGENVYPTEVENALVTHPAVAEAAVFGVPSERWGEEVRAVVFFQPGSAASAAELIEHCRSRIGGYKIPKSVLFSPEPLPKSGPGKIAKTALRTLYGKASPP